MVSGEELITLGLSINLYHRHNRNNLEVAAFVSPRARVANFEAFIADP